MNDDDEDILRSTGSQPQTPSAETTTMYFMRSCKRGIRSMRSHKKMHNIHLFQILLRLN